VIDLAMLTVHFYFTYRQIDNDKFVSEHNVIDGVDVLWPVTDVEVRALGGASKGEG
jgi:hypothetical protein